MVARNYVKVCNGFELLYLGFFGPGKEEEEAMLRNVERVLEANDNAKASVFTRCLGALEKLPVIGQGLMKSSPDPIQGQPVKDAALTEPQIRMLGRLVAGPIVCVYHELPTGRALVRRDYAELISDATVGEYRIQITASGLSKLEAGK
jgi:hypothetical protein